VATIGSVACKGAEKITLTGRYWGRRQNTGIRKKKGKTIVEELQKEIRSGTVL
jgi:hypothetical protein